MTTSSPDPLSLATFLPTLEAAKSTGCIALDDPESPFELPDGKPTAERRLAALIVHARVIRREVRDEDAEMSSERASALLPDMPPAPADFFEQDFRVRLSSPSDEGRCSMCDIRKPGSILCTACSGEMALIIACPSCVDGFVPCPQCDGTGKTVHLRFRYGHDAYVQIVDTFVSEAFRYIPSLFAFPARLRDMLAGVIPPMSLAFPIAAPIQSGGYRDSGRREREHVFNGHRFDDAIEAAQRALGGMVKPRTEIVLFDVRTFAWPFLWLEYDEGIKKRHCVIVARQDGRLCGYGKETDQD